MIPIYLRPRYQQILFKIYAYLPENNFVSFIFCVICITYFISASNAT